MTVQSPEGRPALQFGCAIALSIAAVLILGFSSCVGLVVVGMGRQDHPNLLVAAILLVDVALLGLGVFYWIRRGRRSRPSALPNEVDRGPEQ